jgi:hypothetical protein
MIPVKSDARQLDHKTLEAIRIRAIQQVQSGESPEADIERAVHSRLRLLQRNPEEVRSLFRAESTAYAA